MVKFIPPDESPPGVGQVWLEAGDSVEVHEGKVLVVVYQGELPRYTLRTDS